MPLLRRKPFERIKPPRDLRPDEEVFHCTLTNEVFRDYEEFYERIILCNSLVWSCSLTGKPNLTYSEAKSSETAAKKLVDGYPKELQVPTLYIASLAQRTSFLDLVEDVYGFMKERYFTGEKLEALLDDGVVDCIVTKVIAPSSEQHMSPTKSPGKSKVSSGGSSLNPDKYHYECVAQDKEWTGTKLLQGSDLRRTKGRFTRDKHKLFLRFNTESGSGGIVKIKDFAQKKYKLSTVTFASFCAGPEPNFQQSKKALKVLNMGKEKMLTPEEKELRRKEIRNQRRKEKRQQLKDAKLLAEHQQNSQTPRKRSESGSSPGKSPRSAGKTASSKKKEPVKKLTAEQQRELLMEKMRQKKEADRVRILQERKQKRLKAREEKRKLEEFYKEWSKPREDLLCEDLKELPAAFHVQCRIPNDLFGDFIAVLEFFMNFKRQIRLNDFFPKGVTFEILERALCDKEVAGPLSDIMQMLLNAIFNLQEEEEEAAVQTTDLDAKVELGVGESKGSVTCEEAIRSATAAANWSQTFQGLSLNKLTLDTTTVSEILRLHLLSSGGRSNEANSNWRFQERGGYTMYDDPGLNLRINEPQIFHHLRTKNYTELSIGEKLKILLCLMHQILMFASVRDVILETVEKLKKSRAELRNLQQAEKRRELEELNRMRQEKQKNKEGEGENAAPAPPAHRTEEADAERTKREKDSAKRRADFLSKEHKIQAEITALEWSVTAMPLGTDRAHRRYWIFQSIPGLFVEHVVDDVVGPCLKNGTPPVPVPLCEDPMEYVRHLFEKQPGHRSASEEASNGSSDKENERSPQANKQKPVPSSACSSVTHSPKDRLNGDDEKVSKQMLLLSCTGEQDLCPVHSTVLPRVHWAFYNRPAELDALLQSLNPRGLREAELRQTLALLRPQLEASMQKCPAPLLGRPEDEEMMEVANESTRRSARQAGPTKDKVDPNFNFPPGTAAHVIFESSLRDCILDLEDKIHLGGLGTLKVESREEWRSALENGGYDRQCERLCWGGRRHPQSEGLVAADKLVNKIKVEERASRPGTPDSIESGPTFQDLGDGGDEGRDENLCRVVKNIASALLQVEQAIENRYFQLPLGLNEKERLRRQKLMLAKFKEPNSEESEEEEEEGEDKEKKEQKPRSTPLERWEVSLMASTSLAQLFVHFSTLENSIIWAKSALNARCRVCRRKGDGENMLLCDSCDKGHHLYCLKPQLKNVPQGEWFCPSCRPKEVPPPTPRKARRQFVEEEESEEEEEEEEDDDGEEEEGEDEVEEEQEESAEEGEEETQEGEEEEEEEEDATCASCGEAGDTVKCEQCRSCYHPECANPRLRCVPRTAWTCQDCRDASTKKASSKRHGAVVLAHKSMSSRRSAREANTKISKAAKRLRSDSWDDSDSSRAASEERGSRREQRARRQPRWLTLECEDPDLPLNTTLLDVLLQDLMGHTEAWPFLRPVQKHEAPDYHQIIKRPMDLGTIKYKLHQMEYRNNSQCLADVCLIFENCEMYNQPTADEYKAGQKLRKFFERKYQDLGLKIQPDELSGPPAKRPRRL